MKTLPAWIEVDNNNLLDHIDTMVFWNGSSADRWSWVAVGLAGSGADNTPLEPSAETAALVCFDLPSTMKCVKPGTSGKTESIASAIGSSIARNTHELLYLWVPCLPVIHARGVIFAEDMAEKSFQSNMRRLLPGKGEWLKTRVVSRQPTITTRFEPNEHSCPDTAGSSDSIRNEKLAAAMATAVLLGRSEISSDRSITFDTGSIALLRQILTHHHRIPDAKALQSDARFLIKGLFDAARSHNLKPGSLPRNLPQKDTGALQLARTVQQCLEWIPQDSGETGSLLPAADKDLPDETQSFDQRALQHLLRLLMELDGLPAIREVIEIFEQTAEALGSGPSKSQSDNEMALEAIRILIANIESPEERIDRFRERFGQLPGIVGAAHVFWGWSENPQDNFEHRLTPLKASSRTAHQSANIIFSAAGGAGRLPVRYFRSRMWTAAYEAAWAFLLSSKTPNQAVTAGQDIWQIETGELSLTDSGPLVEIRVGSGRIPLGLQISDPLLMVQTIAERLLASPETAGKAATAILAAMDQDIGNLPRDLRNLVEIRLTVHIGKNLQGEITGSSITFHNIRESDMTMERHWSDPTTAAQKILHGKTLSRILERIPGSQIGNLGKQLTALPKPETG